MDMELLEKMAEARKTKTRPTPYILQWSEKNTPDDAERQSRSSHLLNGFNRAMGIGQENVFYYNARGGRFKSTPEGKHFLNEWYKNAVADREVMDAVWYDLDPVESYRDYALWWYKKTLETGAMDQMYRDDLFLSPNTNLVGADAYFREDGSIQPANGIFNLRELIRRSAYMMQEMGRTSRFVLHMTSTNIAPILSYGAMNFDWEENLGFIDFQDRHPREYIRAMSHGRQSGNLPIMLVATTSDPVKSLSPEEYRHWLRTAAGVMLTHELRWHKEYPEFWNTLKLLYDLGYAAKNSSEYNYWEEDYPVSFAGGKTSSLVSAGNGKAVIMVCDRDEGGDYTMTFDKAKLGLPEKVKAFNAETGAALPVNGSKVSFQLKKHDFMILELK